LGIYPVRFLIAAGLIVVAAVILIAVFSAPGSPLSP
jgi:hypothetical protein